jgi:hypothetical protein
MTKLCEVIGVVQNKDLLSKTYVLEIFPCSTMDCHIGLTKVGNQSKHLKYFVKKKAFRTNLEYMFKCAATNLDTQHTTTQQRLTCTKKCQVAA